MHNLLLKYKIFIKLAIINFIFIYNTWAQNDSTYFQSVKKNQSSSNKSHNFHIPDKIGFGGNFAFFATQNYFFLDLSPLITYRLSSIILLGAGPVYTYYNEKSMGGNFSFNMYGLRTMARIFVLQNIFFQFGWDKLNRSIYSFTYNNIQEKRIWIDNVWIGGGIKYPISDAGYLFSSILFNLNQNMYSPYPNPYMQVGFITGF